MSSELSDDCDRAAILARRRLLVGSALGLLSCSSQNGGADGTSVEVPAPGSAAPTPSTTAISREPVRSRASWAEVMRLAPPLDYPTAGVSTDEISRLSSHRERMTNVFKQVGETWSSAPPPCDVRSCEAKWSEAAKAIADAHQQFRYPLCGWGDTPAILIERFEAASAFLNQQLAVLEADLELAAKETGGSQEWLRLSQGKVRPQPCLSCVRPGPDDPLSRLYVPFEEGASSVQAGSGPDKLLSVLRADPGLRITLRGHADQQEPVDHDALSKARASAVREWLIREGIPSNRITAIGMGAELMISSPHGPSRAQNRRVDVHKSP